jgi:hypothetical protein
MSTSKKIVSRGVNKSASSGDGADTPLAVIGGIPVVQRGDVIYWTAGLAIDADGSPHAYHPDSALGLDRLANAGHPGNWWGVVTDNGKASGPPVIQSLDDPAPGYFISTTSLEDWSRDWNDPARQVNAETIPFIVLPANLPDVYHRLGDFAVVVNLANGKKAGAIVADIGPTDHIGEASIALAQALDIPSDPRTGGASADILVVVFSGSRTAPAWPHTLAELNACVAALVTLHHLNLPNLPTA